MLPTVPTAARAHLIEAGRTVRSDTPSEVLADDRVRRVYRGEHGPSAEPTASEAA